MKCRKIATALIASAILLSLIVVNGLAFHTSMAGTKAGKHDSLITNFSYSKQSYTDAQWYIKSGKGIDMNVNAAWDYLKETGKAKNEVVIAVIDTGIDYKHPDLAKNMWRNPGEIPGDNIDNDHNGYIDDVYGWDFYNNDATICNYVEQDENVTASIKDNDNHGTHVAGIIAAVANNNIGINGVASNINVKIMSLKVNGGTDGSGSMESAVDAIKYAEKMGADICNISWGALGYTDELKETIKNSNMLFVAAAGNFSSDNDIQPVYPASFGFDNIISVTAIDSNGNLGEKADYGMGMVDIAAPGINIYSTIVGGYGRMSGTSMAAPQVSAIAALLYASDDNMNAAHAKNLIDDNIKHISSLNGKIKHAGIPDAYGLLKASNHTIKKEEVKPNTIQNKQLNPVVPNNSKIQIIPMNTQDILPKENVEFTVMLMGQLNLNARDNRYIKPDTNMDRKRCCLYRRI